MGAHVTPASGTPWPLRRVFQEHEDGCGIACLAMLAGISYAEARATIFGDTEADATSFADLRWGLMAHGFRVPRRMTPFWEGWYTQLRQPALLAINPMANGMWHWAVWDAENRRILDPLRKPPRPVVVGHTVIERRPGSRPTTIARLSPRQRARPPATAMAGATP